MGTWLKFGKGRGVGLVSKSVELLKFGHLNKEVKVEEVASWDWTSQYI